MIRLLAIRGTKLNRRHQRKSPSHLWLLGITTNQKMVHLQKISEQPKYWSTPLQHEYSLNYHDEWQQQQGTINYCIQVGWQ